ncbi:hypothetical protein AB833_06865 [Chromatiales bacterium (ex Bugula neritina AB1)]|nr:hypothetical protein AB833_06865 [Chromatiales bacterium (ex Bugula neritina AB1)]
MIIGMWVLALALAVLLVNRSLERSRNPNDAVVSSVDGGKRSISLQQNRWGHYLVTGSINGSAIDFLVDTGASTVSIPADFAARIGLPKGDSIPISTANGMGVAYRTRIDSLTIGDLEIRNATAHINPGLSGEVLLGMSVLKHYELVQRGNQLIIREP